MQYFLLVLIYSTIIFSYEQKDCNIDAKESGINHIRPGDVGMVLYIVLVNPCKVKFHINVKMLHCTEQIGEAEEETDSIYLIGGYMGILYPNSKMKATYVYPNMYLFNRRAVCTMGICYTNPSHETRELRAMIKFDTTLNNGGHEPDELQAYCEARNCRTVDQDELDKCAPVDCMMKYSGFRNFFNQKFKRCQKVPVCISDTSKDDPDVAYIPTSNRCRNLANSVTENDLSSLEEGLVVNASDSITPARGLVLRCNHGRLDNNTGLCVCKKGWTSGDEDPDNYVPGLSVYHMCNIKFDSWYNSNIVKLRKTVLAFSIFAVIITMVILLLTFSLYGCYLLVRDYEGASPFENTTDDKSSEIELDMYQR